MIDKERVATGQAVVRELHEQVKQIAESHGLTVPHPPYVITERGVFLNLSLYWGDADVTFADLFKEHAKSHGLDPSWLGKTCLIKEYGVEARLVGLDPDGGERFVRLQSVQGVEAFHVTPEAARKLFSGSESG